MHGAIQAIREWLELRARVRQERSFHLDCAIEDFRNLGLSLREARRRARARFGRRNLRASRRELGADFAGLRGLLRAHQAFDSPWRQPALCLSVIALIFLISPGRQEIANGILIRTYTAHFDRAVAFAVEGRSPWSGGAITPSEYAALRSLTTVTGVTHYQGLYAQARAIPGATLAAIQFEARARTRQRFVVSSIADRRSLAIGPAQAVWLFATPYVLFLVFRHRTRRRSCVWTLYRIGLAALHAVMSLVSWTFMFQIWNRWHAPGGAPALATLFIAYLWMVAVRCRWLWAELRRRCPVCLTRLILSLTSGSAELVLLRPAVTESVCCNGHGVLVESRWLREFRAEESPLEALIGT